MYTLAPDEKTAAMMIYTQTAMLHCEAVVKSGLTRLSTWLRTQGAPEYIHLVNVQMVSFVAGAVKQIKYDEFFLPLQQVVAYHLPSTSTEPVDYDPNEANRMMMPATLHIGTFVMAGTLRIAANSTIGSQLEASHSPWTSLYDLSVTNPNLAGFQYKAPMALFSPGKVLIGL